MFPNFLIAFREVLEMSLIVGIVLSYLNKTNQTKYNNVVYVGIGAGIVGSIIGALLFHELAGDFAGRSEQIFEGVTMLIGAGLLTSMIIWMRKQKNIAKHLEQKIEAHASNDHRLGLFLLVFISILREGIETVIFLSASSLVSADTKLIGVLSGIVAAIILGYLMFVTTVRIDLKKFFTVTSTLLILFAAGLVAHGVHELGEAHLIPELIEHVWDINPMVYADGTFPLLHEKGYIGQLLTSLFGYNGNPSLMEVLSYIIYIGVAWLLYFQPHFFKKEPQKVS